jgi:hypothetical protein
MDREKSTRGGAGRNCGRELREFEYAKHPLEDLERFSSAMSSCWTFVDEEVSPGCYVCEGIRQTHQHVSREGFEQAMANLLRDAFALELQLGTSVEEAAYRITASFQKSWSTEIHESLVGSWHVGSMREPRHAEYDGERRVLSLYRDGRNVWRGALEELTEPECGYFARLASF